MFDDNSSNEELEIEDAQNDKTQTEDNCFLEKEPHHALIESETQNNLMGQASYEVYTPSDQHRPVLGSPPKLSNPNSFSMNQQK